MRILLLLLTSLVLFCSSSICYAKADYRAARGNLVKDIEENVRATRHHIDKARLDPKVMQAMGTVPRHEFVPSHQKKYAYQNRPLGIGHGQTISQPYIVALMTDLLELTPESRALEIGTGSGYQAAILAELIEEVYTIEIIKPLGEEVAKRLQRLKLDTIHARIGDGYYGWSEHGPYDAIIVTAAAGHVPPPLVRQLKVGGRMVIPVGSAFQTQQLLLVIKESEERIITQQILPVVFVPLTGGH